MLLALIAASAQAVCAQISNGSIDAHCATMTHLNFSLPLRFSPHSILRYGRGSPCISRVPLRLRYRPWLVPNTPKICCHEREVGAEYAGFVAARPSTQAGARDEPTVLGRVSQVRPRIGPCRGAGP